MWNQLLQQLLCQIQNSQVANVRLIPSLQRGPWETIHWLFLPSLLAKLVESLNKELQKAQISTAHGGKGRTESIRGTGSDDEFFEGPWKKKRESFSRLWSCLWQVSAPRTSKERLSHHRIKGLFEMDEEFNSNIGKLGNKKRVIPLQKVGALRDQEGLILVTNFIKRFEELGIQWNFHSCRWS